MRPAAAQIAVQSLPHLLPGRGETLAQQAGRGHHHAGGAIAALGGLLIDERLLDRMKPAASRQPLHRDDRAVHGRHRQIEDERAWSPMSTKHAPHSPIPQPNLGSAKPRS